MKKLLVAFCVAGTSMIVQAQPKTLYIDPGKTIGAPASRIFDSVNFIPLETSKKSLLGTVKQLVVTDSLYIVLDTDTDALYFFNRKGKFVLKYKTKRYRIRDIQLDRSKNALLIFSLNKNYTIPAVKVQEYLEPESSKDVSKYAKATWFYLDHVKAARTEDLKNFRYAFTNPVRFGHNKFAASFIKSKRNSKDTLDHQLKIITDTALTKTFFPYNKKTESIYYFSGASQCSMLPTNRDSVLFITRPFKYEIYTLTPSVIVTSYRLILPVENAIPASFFTTSFSSRGEMETYKAEHPSYASQIDNIVGFPNLLFFDLTLFRGHNRYILDKNTSLIYDYNKITADSTSCFLPLSGTIKGFDDHYIYQAVSAKTLLQAKKAADFREPRYSTSLIRFFKTEKESSNPVLIQLKPKDRLLEP